MNAAEQQELRHETAAHFEQGFEALQTAVRQALLKHSS